MISSGKTERLACALVLAALSVGTSCVKKDGTLGQDYIPSSHIWKVATATFDIDKIEMLRSSELGGYSSKRVAIGGIKDSNFGWGERASAFPLIPLVDTLTFSMAEDAVCTGFHFALAKDTLSFADPSEERILQSIRVYELLKPLDDDILYSGNLNGETYIGEDGQSFQLYDSSVGVVTDGIPIYNGGDSLSFNFTKAFGQKYLDALKGMKLGSVSEYAKTLPGIIITCDRPLGSGRINLFECTVSTDDYNYLTGNYIVLRYRATFDDRGPIDTSMVFLAGMSGMMDSATSTLPSQYAFNFSTSEEVTPEGQATGRVLVEGGSGLKPVIRATTLKKGIEEQIAAVIKDYIPGYSEMSESEQEQALKDKLSQTIVNRATVVMPYDVEGGFDKVDKYPKVLSPTCRIETTRTLTKDDGSTKKQNIVSFAGLTDASVSSENQGDINRSLNCYQPDISHHVQEILRQEGRKEDESEDEYAERLSRYDIWMLIMHPETTTTSSSGDSSYNDYLNALAYSSYYNNLYGYGGYGYGSYGYGYDSYYNNYYNYMMMAAYASQSTTTTTSSVELDKDRYYNGILYGPAADKDHRPKMTVTFSFPKE